MSSPYPDPSQTNIDAAFSNAEALFNQRRFDEALGIYQNVLAALETRHGPSHPELAYPLQRLGDCHHALNQFRDSLPLYQRLLSIGDKILGLSHPDMLNLMLKIARTQEMIGSFQESKKTYETLLPIIESAKGPSDPFFKSARQGYELILARIDENKKAADAWRESSQSGSQQMVSAVSSNSGVPLPGADTGPHQQVSPPIAQGPPGMNIEVPDRAADPSAFENAPAAPPGPVPGSGTFGANAPPPPPNPMVGSPVGAPREVPPNMVQGNSSQAQPAPPSAPPEPEYRGTFPGGSSAPPPGPSSSPPSSPDFGNSGGFGRASSSPPIPGTFPGSSQQSPPSHPSPRPSAPSGGGQDQFSNSPQGPGQFPGSGPQVEQNRDSGRLPSLPPGVVPPQDFDQGSPPFQQPGQMPPPTMPGQMPAQVPEQMPGQMPGQLPINSVGPVTEIPGSDAMPSTDLGFENRKSDPSNDPYLDHLANRVTSLTPPEKLPQDPIVKSGAWHGADVLAALDLPGKDGSTSSASYGQMDDEEYDPDLEDEELEQEKRSQKLRAARSAASKSEGIVAMVRSFKEYLVSGLALLIVGAAGYYFFTHTEQRRTALAPRAIESTATLESADEHYMTPDRGMRLTLDGSGSCTLFHNALGIKVPYNYYDSNISTIALQSVDSVLERQHWFKKIPEGLETEQGVILYANDSPDFRVLAELERLKQTVSAWYQRNGSYPSELVKIPKGIFAYTNPFTGVKEEMKINFARFTQVRGQTLRDMIRTGQTVTGDGTMNKGKIVGYIHMESDQATKQMRAVAFYMRAVNRHGQFFNSSTPGEKLFVGFKGGVDDGNDITYKEEPKLYRVEKPTKVWISKMPQVPLPLIHRSLPIVLGFLGFFLFLRSLMLAPGQSPDNNVNKTFRLCGWVLIIITVGVLVAQVLLWR